MRLCGSFSPREKSVRRGFAKIFRAMIRENKAQHERGCLLMNTNLSRAVDDVEVREFLRDNQKQVEEIFIAAFVDAQERREIEDLMAASETFSSRLISLIDHPSTICIRIGSRRYGRSRCSARKVLSSR
jgi:hypothetical protein